MIMLQGTTNGFRFSESLIHVQPPAARFAVIPIYHTHYAVATNGAAKRVAKRNRSLGFWRVKKSA